MGPLQSLVRMLRSLLQGSQLHAGRSFLQLHGLVPLSSSSTEGALTKGPAATQEGCPEAQGQLEVEALPTSHSSTDGG